MENKEELDLRDLFGFIKKRVWLIIIITLLTTLITAVISVFIISPPYEAKVGILIGKQQDGNRITDSDINMYQNLMQTYKDIAETNKVAKMAAEKLDNGLSVKDLLKRTTVTVETGTMILYIGSQSNGASDVYKEVQAYADAFIETANTLIPDGNVKIMDYALVPEAPTSPNIYLNTAIGFIAGLLLSVLISFLLEYMNNTIVTKEDAEKYLELPVIGNIPENNIE